MYGPTGSGKTRVAIELFKWMQSLGGSGVFYVNRRLLIAQTSARFAEAGLAHGIRAAEFPDAYDYDAPFQIASADTERARVLKRGTWKLADAALVIVDEAHLQKTQAMQAILDKYREQAAMIVGLTATPVGLSKWYDKLIISGTMSQYRDCHALVPAIVRSIEHPDLSKIERKKTGEYVLDGRKRQIYTQSIVGNVLDRWKKYNPDARPTFLYAPGKAESVWFTSQFAKMGVSWCHVDATDCVIEGKRAPLTRSLWQEILQRYKDGSIKGLSSRFKLREGIDVPSTYHCILATPIGSLASYVQTVGRVLRYSPQTPDFVLVTDHGGNYLRFGSPNANMPWETWWDMPERAVSEWHERNVSEGRTPEPILCPECEGERTSGPQCPHCGFEHPKSERKVLMPDGRLVVRDGHLIPRKKPKPPSASPAQQDWTKMYFAWTNGPSRGEKTFAQMAVVFKEKHGFYPPESFPYRPTRKADWHAKIKDVPKGRLSHRQEQA
jgi:superfamily II DNA or RNA helicase